VVIAGDGNAGSAASRWTARTAVLPGLGVLSASFCGRGRRRSGTLALSLFDRGLDVVGGRFIGLTRTEQQSE
jgi:hypothetical protein